ncbi:glycosyltransferase family 39 protein [Sphingomicrobium arenosum]|uniref:glycosyltransferase family 39 protein n=1 Tax=Sphingomicrobium arenosum TaxID=2233861 RepID=UPI00223F8E66|nr:glycosyltransferase family 39 protein [Sphingomicrobium arenosum]
MAAAALPRIEQGVSGRGAESRLFTLMFALLLASLPLIALVSPIDHDETQYLAAAELFAAGLTPFRDFLYLQTPYQIYLFGPLFHFSDHGLMAARFVSGLMGAGVIALVFAALRESGVARREAMMAAGAIWFCHAFLFGVTVVRNDALPALLLALAFFLAMGALRPDRVHRRYRWLGAGLALGAATGTKISYLAMAGAFVGFPVIAVLLGAMGARRALATMLVTGAGVTLALVPLLWIREGAAAAFDYGNFGYHAEAPFLWYGANGRELKLTLGMKLLDGFVTLARGPALAALILYAVIRIRSLRLREKQAPALLLVDLAILAGLVATLAPTPIHRQYAIPLLPPLFLGLGLVWRRQRDLWPSARWPRRLLVAGLAVGLIQPLYNLSAPLFEKPTPTLVRAEGQLLADLVAAEGIEGEIATLSPEIVVGSGLALDPVFATGPFAYRTADMIAVEEREALGLLSPSTVKAHLARTRPAAIVTGYEARHTIDRIGLEAPIEAFAREAGYRRVESGVGGAVFWLRSRAVSTVALNSAAAPRARHEAS